MTSKTPSLAHVLEHCPSGVEFVARLMGVHEKIPVYMVELGDCARDIAEKHGIDPSRWRELYEANGMRIYPATPASYDSSGRLLNSGRPEHGRTFSVGEMLILPEGWRRAF